MTNGTPNTAGIRRMSSQPLKVPPLTEVAFEINYAPHLHVEDRIADFQDEIKSDFPNYFPEIVLRLPGPAHRGGRTRDDQPVQPIKTHTFLSLNSKRTVKVSTVNLNVIVQDYVNFDEYVQSATRCLKVGLDKFQIREIFRIGLRYVNFIKIEKTDEHLNVRKYIRPVLTQELETTASTYLVETTERRGEKKLTMRSGLLGAESESGFGRYILDFDCFSDHKQTIQAIEDVLHSFHDIIEERFHQSVSQEYLKFMRTGLW